MSRPRPSASKNLDYSTDSDGGNKDGRRRGPVDKSSDEYKRRRERNNEAVKKSRSKAKERTAQTLERVNQLQSENVELNQKINILNKEFELLKEMYTTHAKLVHQSDVQDLDDKLNALTNYSYIPVKPEPN